MQHIRLTCWVLTMQTESGQGYNLDCSLFERLVKGGFPVATLVEQRRMRPSVARLIRDTIYPNLKVGMLTYLDLLTPDSAFAMQKGFLPRL